MNEISRIFTEKSISDVNFQNPFTSAGVYLITMSVHRAGFLDKKDYPRGSWVFDSVIHFQKGDTKGEQNFDASSFEGLMKKMQAFCEQLD